MSKEAFVWVMDNSRNKGSAKLVLLAIASYAQPDGSSAFPSVSTLSNKTGISERQIKRLITSLENSGELTVERSKGRKANIYKILMFKPKRQQIVVQPLRYRDKMSPLTVTKPTTNGDKPNKSTVTFATPPFKEEPINEPVINRGQRIPPEFVVSLIMQEMLSEIEDILQTTLTHPTKARIAMAIPQEFARAFASYISARSIGYLEVPDKIKLEKLSYWISDFQRDYRTFSQNRSPSRGSNDAQARRIKAIKECNICDDRGYTYTSVGPGICNHQ
jgi:hypothetical protein